MIDVVVVDDDFMVARVHAGHVAKAVGFRVVATAHTGTEAVRAVAEHRPGLVLLDIYLPDVHGLDVLRRIRAATPAAPEIIVITAARDLDTVRGALRGGALHYLIKPFAYSALHEQLDAVRERHHAMTALAGAGTAEQHEVDLLFGGRSATVGATRKGVAEETARLVEQALREADAAGTDLSAVECARATELSRVSARRYLEHFVRSGHAEVRPRYGGTGRPEHRYRWTNGTHSSR